MIQSKVEDDSDASSLAISMSLVLTTGTSFSSSAPIPPEAMQGIADRLTQTLHASGVMSASEASDYNEAIMETFSEGTIRFESFPLPPNPKSTGPSWRGKTFPGFIEQEPPRTGYRPGVEVPEGEYIAIKSFYDQAWWRYHTDEMCTCYPCTFSSEDLGRLMVDGYAATLYHEWEHAANANHDEGDVEGTFDTECKAWTKSHAFWTALGAMESNPCFQCVYACRADDAKIDRDAWCN